MNSYNNLTIMESIVRFFAKNFGVFTPTLSGFTGKQRRSHFRCHLKFESGNGANSQLETGVERMVS